MKKVQQLEWDTFYSNSPDDDFYIEWLEPYLDIIKKFPEDTVLDLGCGMGRDADYLSRQGYRVLGCDYSEEALKIINNRYPKIETKEVDLHDPIPFPYKSTGIIIMNLSLHYYAWEKTLSIRDQLYNILKPGGYLILRLNSDRDLNHGAGMGTEIEKGYYFYKNRYKRFFNRNIIERLFPEPWIIHKIEELEIKRYYGKVIYEVLLEKPQIKS